MAPKRKPPQNIGELDFSKKLADSLSRSKEPDTPAEERRPINGEQVRVGTSETVWTILSVSYSGLEVNLHVPNTNLERRRVMIRDLVYIDDPIPPRLKQPEKPEIDVDAIREGIEEYQHSIIDHLQGEVAALKKFIRGKGVSADKALDRFAEATEEAWNESAQAIMKDLEK